MIINVKGFTLIEFLVAIVILMVGLLGLLQSINLALSTNLDNLLREEATMLADDKLMSKRSMAFDSMSAKVIGSSEKRNIRGVFKDYSVRESVSFITASSKQIDIDVIWKVKQKRTTHSVSSVVSIFPQ